MTTVDALKSLYTALGGKSTDTYSTIAGGIAVSDYVLIPDCISAIAEVAGSTIELPAVTAEDNGSVLKVVDGAWAVGTDNITA